MNKPTLVSLFSGAGGLDLGLEQAGLSPEAIAAAVARANFEQKRQEESPNAFGVLAVEVLIALPTYTKIQSVFSGVSDEHNFKQLIDVLCAQ